VRKSYDVLVKEHETALSELVKQQRHVFSLANSVRKRGTDATYKKALTYLNKAAWWGKELVYIVKVVKQGSATWVGTWILREGNIYYRGSLLNNPNDAFLANPPIKDTEPLRVFMNETVKQAMKIYRQYKDKQDGRPAATDETKK
jgi:hypothetical protein